MTEHHIYYVDAAPEDVRLDTFLTAHLPAHSRSRIKALIETGHVTVDRGTAKPAHHLRRAQLVYVVLPPPPPATVAPEDIPLPVVCEDEPLLVINKPPALTVHPGAGRPSGTLVNAVLARVPGLAGVGSRQRPGIVHRLDKDTSGLLVVAKTPVAYASLSSQVARRTVNRTYLALVHGVLPHDERTITAPIGRHPRHRSRMAVVPRGREAITRYRVVERLARYSHVGSHRVTGRTPEPPAHVARVWRRVRG